MWYRSLCLYLLCIIRWNLFVLRNDINTAIIIWNRSLFRRLLSALCPCCPFPTKLQIAALLCIISHSETPFLVKYRILMPCFYVKYRVLDIFFVSLHAKTCKYHRYGWQKDIGIHPYWPAGGNGKQSWRGIMPAAWRESDWLQKHSGTGSHWCQAKR